MSKIDPEKNSLYNCKEFSPKFSVGGTKLNRFGKEFRGKFLAESDARPVEVPAFKEFRRKLP